MAFIEDHQAEVVYGILSILISGSQVLDGCHEYVSIPILSAPSSPFDEEIVSEAGFESILGLLS